jgi:hypothetical protein
MREVTLHAGSFARSSLHEISRREGISIDSLLQRALRYYLADRESRRVSWRYPPFLRHSGRYEGDVTVHLDDDLLGAAEKEAEKQDVSVERLLEHALLYFLAALETGQESAPRSTGPAQDPPRG